MFHLFEMFCECQKRSFGILSNSYSFQHPELFPGSGSTRCCQESRVPKCRVTSLTWERAISDPKEARNIWDIQKRKILFFFFFLFHFFFLFSSHQRNSGRVLVEVHCSGSGSDQVLSLHSSRCPSWRQWAKAVLNVLKVTLYSIWKARSSSCYSSWKFSGGFCLCWKRRFIETEACGNPLNLWQISRVGRF